MTPEHKKRQSVTLRALIMIIVLCLALGTGVGFFVARKTSSRESSTGNAILDKIVSLLEDKWVDTTGSDTDMESRMIEGLVDGLGDQATTWMSEDEAEEFSDSLNGSDDGIGVMFMAIDSGAFVTRIISGSPAEEAGLRAGDIIIQSDGVSLEGKTASEIRNLMTGESGTNATLKVQRGSETPIIKVQRAAIETSVFYDVRENNGTSFGYIQVLSISSGAETKIEEALKAFRAKGITTLVMDMRDNGGGYLDTARSVLDLFNEKGTVLYSTAANSGEKKAYKASSDTAYNFDKGYVLVNGSTASAAEIIAAGLRDLNGFKLVGSMTYGKGTIQTRKTLSDKSVLKYTYAQWYTAKGESINKKGLTPDLEVRTLSYSDLDLTSFDDTYKQDDVSDHIATMETLLDAMGYNPGRTDGYFSTQAETALKTYQKDNSLDQTGTLNESTVKYLLASYSLYMEDLSHDTIYQQALTDMMA